jgi:hypothetical protein
VLISALAPSFLTGIEQTMTPVGPDRHGEVHRLCRLPPSSTIPGHGRRDVTLSG